MIEKIKNLLRRYYPATKSDFAMLKNERWYPIINTTPMPLIHFSIHLTEHCNLNCRSCSHFCNLHPKEEFLSLEEFQKDFERLSELFHGEAEYIHLMGGEPLLHPQLTEFFPIARKCFPDADLKILTNGILLPQMSDEFWENCARYDIMITPSLFPLKIDYKALQKKAETFGVKLLMVWEKSTFRKDVLDLRGFQDPVMNFLQCWHPHNCTFFAHGKFCTCNIPLNIGNFNDYFHQNLKVSRLDYIDIYEAKSGKEILEFLAKPIPFCRYCALNKCVSGLPWSQSAFDISEWT